MTDINCSKIASFTALEIEMKDFLIHSFLVKNVNFSVTALEQAAAHGDHPLAYVVVGKPDNNAKKTPVDTDELDQEISDFFNFLFRPQANAPLNLGVIIQFLSTTMHVVYNVSQKDLLIYNKHDGIYVNAIFPLKRMLAMIVSCIDVNSWNGYLESKVIDLLVRTVDKKDITDFDQHFLAFKEQALDLNKLEFVPFDQSQNCTIKIDYQPINGQTPQLDDFLRTTFNDDQFKSVRSFVLQWFGLQFDIESKDAAAMLWCISPGASGKSVFMSIIRNLVGPENVVSPALSELGGTFGLEPLLKKVSLISDESDGSFPFNRVKALISGNSQMVARKYKQPVESNLTAKITIGFNQLPVPERTLGFERRVYLLPFPNSFLGKQADIHLTERLQQEIPHIAFAAIQALKELRQNDYALSTTSEMDRAKKEYFDQYRDVVQLFLQDRYHLQAGNRLKKSDFFKKFVAWTLKKEIDAQTVQTSKGFWTHAARVWQSVFKVARPTIVKSNGTNYVVGLAENRSDDDAAIE
ncbi:DNA primase family protein [Liquorilactobacillus nagelii]|jgi:P4 family phage/plasmid primase-like protien|uniref:DNA primase family protein n=1 Tax=Liquorilactobacillus nagelii TaxID=82688 RepID=UPI00242EB98E|nr:phage/plasmid primase, P4 family [Liquorilactobacillus nagelii]MCI1700788.1 phage/plasmid primase, P4 family [Liquorilactobacillus nagelii]